MEIVEESMNQNTNTRSRGRRPQSGPGSQRHSILDDLMPDDDEKKEDISVRLEPAKMTSELKHKLGQNQRPYTADIGFNQGLSTQKEEVIEEISIPFSRRRSKALRDRDQSSTRPHTTPIENSRNYILESNPVRNEDSQTYHDNTSNFDLTNTNIGGHRDEDEDTTNEYVAAVLRGRDKPKPRSKPVEVDYDPTGILVPRETTKKPHVLKDSFGVGGATRSRQDDGPTSRSQKGVEYLTAQPEYSVGAGSLQALEQTKQFNRDHDGFSQLHVDNAARTFGGRGDARHSISNKILITNTAQPGAIYQAFPKTELSLPGLEDLLAKPQFGVIDRQYGGDEISSKMYKETIEHYKAMIEELKRHFLEERAKNDENHAQAIALLRKEKEMLSEQMEFALQRERERLKDIHAQELQGRERIHKLELEQQKRIAEENAESLKKQLEVQMRLGALAEDFRHSSFKIETICHKIGLDNSSMEQLKKRELEEREKSLQEKEKRIMNDIAILEKEKLRYDHLMEELHNKEAEITKRGEEDRKILKKEYDRLYELQNMLKEKEIESKKELINERIKFEELKAKLEQESSRVIEEYGRKLKDLELRSQLFENEKKEFEMTMQKKSEEITQKSKEIDETRQKLILMEAELFKKIRENEVNERSIIQGLDELKAKVQLFENDRAAFEAERAKLHELAKNSKEETESMRKFKSEFDGEKDRLNRMKIELDTFSVSLQNDKLKLEQERNEVAKAQRVVESLRFGYVKTIGTSPSIRTPVSTMDFSSLSSLETSSKKKHSRSLSAQEFFSKEAQLHSISVKEPSTLGGPTISVKDLRAQIETKGFFRGERTSERVRASSSRSFNLTSYMKDLKTLDRTCEINGEYIYKEKDNLIRSKIEIGTPVKRQSIRPGTFKVESPFK
mgnify:CR=1 FL=1